MTPFHLKRQITQHCSGCVFGALLENCQYSFKQQGKIINTWSQKMLPKFLYSGGGTHGRIWSIEIISPESILLCIQKLCRLHQYYNRYVQYFTKEKLEYPVNPTREHIALHLKVVQVIPILQQICIFTKEKPDYPVKRTYCSDFGSFTGYSNTALHGLCILEKKCQLHCVVWGMRGRVKGKAATILKILSSSQQLILVSFLCVCEQRRKFQQILRYCYF